MIGFTGLLFLSALPEILGHTIKGLSLYGYETEQRAMVCSDVNSQEYYIQLLKDLGFSSLRLPFSTVFVEEGNWQGMDTFMQTAHDLNMSVLLDHHRTFPDRQDISPFERGMTKERFMDAWFTIIDRYVDFPNFVGLNFWNEFVSDDAEFVVNATADGFSMMEERYPERFTYYATGILWSGKLVGVDLSFLPFHERIYYSLHKYIFSIGQNENYETSWEESLGGHPVDRIVIGEYGWENQDQWWGDRFVDWLLSKKIRHSVFWTLARSDGTGGLFEDDCKTFNWNKYRTLRRLWGDKKYLRTAK